MLWWLPSHLRGRWAVRGAGQGDGVPLLHMGGAERGGAEGTGEAPAGEVGGGKGAGAGAGADGLSLRGLRKVYDDAGATTVAVDGVSLDVRPPPARSPARPGVPNGPPRPAPPRAALTERAAWRCLWAQVPTGQVLALLGPNGAVRRPRRAARAGRAACPGRPGS
jgi:hypothetical protein